MARTQLLVHRWAGGGPEQRFRRCFADNLNQILVSSVAKRIGRSTHEPLRVFVMLKFSGESKIFVILIGLRAARGSTLLREVI